MQHSRRKSGLNHAVYVLRAMTCPSILAAGAIVTLKLGGITLSNAMMTGANTIIVGTAVALVIILMIAERTARLDAMVEVQYDVAEINAGAQSLDDLGNDPMTPAVMKKFKWTIAVVLRGVVLFSDLAEWHHEHRAAAWWSAAIGLVAGVAAAVALLIFGARFEPVTASCLAVVAVLPFIAALSSRNALPKSVLGTPEDVANCIFCVIMRLSEGKMAVKNAMISLVDRGVDFSSVLIERKIADWMAGIDAAAKPAATCGCVQHRAEPAAADKQYPAQQPCTCGQHQPPRCPHCQGTL